MRPIIALLVLPFILSACDAITGKEIGRLPINKVSTDDNLIIKEIDLDLKKGDEVGIWSDMDFEYEGDVAFRFRMEIIKDGRKQNEFEIDPTNKNITMSEVRTTFMDKTDWSFVGKNSEIEIPEDGKYTIRGILVASENPSLKLTKAEIVLKK
jgi:hypothetical protein